MNSILAYLKLNLGADYNVALPSGVHPDRINFRVTITSGENKGLQISVAGSFDPSDRCINTILITKDDKRIDNSDCRHDLRTGPEFPHLLGYLVKLADGEICPADYDDEE